MSVDVRRSDEDEDSERSCRAKRSKDLARSDRSADEADWPLLPRMLPGFATYLTIEPGFSSRSSTPKLREPFASAALVSKGSSPRNARSMVGSNNESTSIFLSLVLRLMDRSFSPSISRRLSWIEKEASYILTDLSKTLSSVMAIALDATAELSSKENEPQHV